MKIYLDDERETPPGVVITRMKKYYESHITMTGNPSLIRPLVEQVKWKFSVIDGDPLMGEGIRCYATRLFNAKNTIEDVLENLLNTALFLSVSGIEVTRRKVELVIYDDRSSKMRCEGGCVECHLDDLTQPV